MNHVKYPILTTYRKRLADTITPVSIYLQIRDRFANPILLESSDYHGQEDSFSYICFNPIASFSFNAGQVKETLPFGESISYHVGPELNLVDALRKFSGRFQDDNGKHKFISNGLLQVGREGLGLDHGADFCTDLCKGAHVFGVQALELGADAVGQAVIGQELAERVGGGGKARGHAHALRQLGDHLAEAGVFTAYRLDIGHSQVFKRYDQGGRAEKCRHGKAPEVETGSARPPRAVRRSGGRAAMHRLQLCRCGCRPTVCMVRIG